MTRTTTRRNTLKIKDLMTGKTMTVEEWKAKRRELQQQATTDDKRNRTDEPTGGAA